jgi:hypothetical protein
MFIHVTGETTRAQLCRLAGQIPYLSTKLVATSPGFCIACLEPRHLHRRADIVCLPCRLLSRACNLL